MRTFDLTDASVEPPGTRQLSPEQKERLTEILDRYLSAMESGAPLAREALLEACPDLAAPLGTYLDSLDELHHAAAGFAGASRRVAETEAELPDSAERRLGDFTLLREVGRGGMGVVYEARQISLGRRVALKVLPFAAVLDSKQITRFKNEAQAAAQLNHPGIVPVFAIGMERGVHYYAMQFIDGQPLDRAIAELRETSGFAPAPRSTRGVDASEDEEVEASQEANAEAVAPSTCGSFATVHSGDRHEYYRAVAQLGVQAAEALHAAHEYGVVHRDVKPSNLLLDGDGKLWVTDFGLARCQTNKTLTRTGDVFGTMRYMSPEQALGQSALVDHRTDIYSLGVTLYEMLVLEPAFPGEDGPALLRRIEEQEPLRPRQREPQIPADLQTVVLKAMAKQRDERYATAQELADDLRRMLEGKPIIARPPSVFDRLGKWARRHRRFVAAAASVCLLALLGMAASTLLINRQKAIAEENYQRAQRYFHDARKAVDRFGAVLAERLADVQGAEQVRRDVLQDTLQYYRGFVEQAGDDPSLEGVLALTYSKMGTLAGEIGSVDEAIEAHEKSLALYRRLVAENPKDAESRRRLALSSNNLALALGRSGRIDDARHAYDDAIRLQKELVRDAPDGGQYQCDLARSYNNLGLLQSRTGEVQNAQTSLCEAIRIQEQLLEAHPHHPDYLWDLAASLNNTGALYASQQPERASEYYQKALSCQLEAAAHQPHNARYGSDLALTYNNLGAALSQAGHFEKAAASYTKAIGIQRELVASSPGQKLYQRDLAVSLNNLGLIQSRLGRPSDAEGSFRQALDIEELLVSQVPNDVDLHSGLGGMYNNLGIVLEDLQRNDEAAVGYAKAIEHQQTAYSHAPEVSRYRLFLSKHYFNYGRVLRKLGRPDEAARVALRRRELWPDDPKRLVSVAEELALASASLAGRKGVALSEQQCADSAVRTLRQAVRAGWKPTPEFDRNETFAVLKGRPGFAELMAK